MPTARTPNAHRQWRDPALLTPGEEELMRCLDRTGDFQAMLEATGRKYKGAQSMIKVIADKLSVEPGGWRNVLARWRELQKETA